MDNGWKAASITYSDEKVNHEENVEGQIYLLGCILFPRNTLFNSLAEIKGSVSNVGFVRKKFILSSIDEVYDEGCDGEDEHEGDEDLPHTGLGGDQLPGPVLGLAQEVVLRRLVRVLALN